MMDRKNVVFLGHSWVAHLDRAYHTGDLNSRVKSGAGRRVSRSLDTSIVLDETEFNATFCHRLNFNGSVRKLFKIQDLLDCKDF